MTKKKGRYKVLIGCQNDVKETRFEPGEIVRDGDFSAKTIKEWLELDKDIESGQGPVLELIGD